MNDPNQKDAPNMNERVVLPEHDSIGREIQTMMDGPSMDGMLDRLTQVLEAGPVTPRGGIEAAEQVVDCFEGAAADVEAIAADRVEAALELQQEAKTYATVLREAGRVLAGRVEAETARTNKLSTLLREARDLINGRMDPEEGGLGSPQPSRGGPLAR